MQIPRVDNYKLNQHKMPERIFLSSVVMDIGTQEQDRVVVLN